MDNHPVVAGDNGDHPQKSQVHSIVIVDVGTLLGTNGEWATLWAFPHLEGVQIEDVILTFAAAADIQTIEQHAPSHEPGGSDPMDVDAAAGVGSLRTLGTGATQACAGNDARLSDPRIPTVHATTHQPGGSDPMAVDAAAATGSLRTIGTGATQACAGNDARLSDARTPVAHTHPLAEITDEGALASLNTVGTLQIDNAAVTAAKIASLTSAELATILSDETGTGVAVFAGSPTLTTPSIADFTNAQHDHTSVAEGGTLPAPSLPDDYVEYSKIQNVSAASRVLGRGSAAGAGDIQELTLGGTLSMAGTVLTGSGTPDAHAASHKHGGSDEVATATPAANAIPKANASNKLALGWISEVFAITDASDIAAKTGSGTTVVMSDNPTLTMFQTDTPASTVAALVGFRTTGSSQEILVCVNLDTVQTMFRVTEEGNVFAEGTLTTTGDATINGTSVTTLASAYSAHAAATTGIHGATTTPTASRIPLADGSNKLAAGWIGDVPAPSTASNPTTKSYVDGVDAAIVSALSAPTYICIAADAILPNERVLTAGSGISIVDGGAGGNVTISATGGGGGLTYTAFTKDLGTSRRSGTFDITGLSGLTADKVVNAVQTAAPIASKGNARDEAEMDLITLTGYVVNATTIRLFWQSPSVVVGIFEFAYAVSA